MMVHAYDLLLAARAYRFSIPFWAVSDEDHCIHESGAVANREKMLSLLRRVGYFEWENPGRHLALHTIETAEIWDRQSRRVTT